MSAKQRYRTSEKGRAENRERMRRRRALLQGAAERRRRELNRAGSGCCVDCAQDLPAAELEVDHTLALRFGGEDVPRNLELRCVRDHQAKTAWENSYCLAV